MNTEKWVKKHSVIRSHQIFKSKTIWSLTQDDLQVDAEFLLIPIASIDSQNKLKGSMGPESYRLSILSLFFNLLWCKIHRIGGWESIDDALYVGPDILTHCRPIIFLLLTVCKAGQLKVSKKVRDHRQVLVSVPVQGRQILKTETINWNTIIHQCIFAQVKAKN